MSATFLKWGLLAGVVMSVASIGAVLGGMPLIAEILLGGQIVVGVGLLVRYGSRIAEKSEPFKGQNEREKAGGPDLLLTREMLQGLIDAAGPLVAVVDAAGNVEVATGLGAKLGIEAGKPVEQLKAYALKSAVVGALSTGERTAPEGELAQIRWKEDGENGGERCCLPVAVPLKDEAGRVVAVALSLKELPVSTKEAAGEDAKSKLMSKFSHELKSPMTSIQMAIHLLIEDAADRLAPRQMELLYAARDDVDRLHQLMEKILAEARQTW